MRELILLCVVLLAAGLAYTAAHWPGGLRKTFSQHAATNLQSQIFYAVLFFTTLPMLLLFFATWYVPTLQLPEPFMWFAVLSALFQILCALVPETGGTRTVVHRVFAGISAAFLLPLMGILASISMIDAALRLFAGASLVGMTSLLLVALASQRGHRYALLLQIAYYTLFFAVILLTTYF